VVITVLLGPTQVKTQDCERRITGHSRSLFVTPASSAGRSPAFTPNNAFQAVNASRLTQRPLAIVEGHVSRNITSRIWLSADAYYNVGGETSIDGIRQGNAADTLRLGAGMGARLWPGGDMVLNADSVVAKPESEPNAWGVRLTLRQFW
jgi:hypothetical protein